MTLSSLTREVANKPLERSSAQCSASSHLAGIVFSPRCSGAGLPGIILAVLQPELHCVLLDSSAKRLRFCVQAVAELRLRNVEIVRSRIEHYACDRRFSTVIARAFSALNAIRQASGRLLLSRGRLLVMKGRYPTRELEELGPFRARARVVPLTIPGSSASRHLVIIPASAGDLCDGQGGG